MKPNSFGDPLLVEVEFLVVGLAGVGLKGLNRSNQTKVVSVLTITLELRTNSDIFVC